MTSTVLLRISSVYMFIRLIVQLFFAYEIPGTLSIPQKYLWQASGLAYNHEFFYYGFCIAFGIESRLLWLIADLKETNSKIANTMMEPAFIFIFTFGIEEFVYRFYYSGTATIICSILVGISYFKMKGLSIKITFTSNSEK
jgi:hypothetical protein